MGVLFPSSAPPEVDTAISLVIPSLKASLGFHNLSLFKPQTSNSAQNLKRAGFLTCAHMLLPAFMVYLVKIIE
jgi:hypothetical protein